ncbi:hypothetical protein DXT99_04920 [Pontibacter diazotrophicus]|uniref:Uncharacterized protein n=1 Tax=Pontibacter diazotrophicus TaxID=1400979 RepID=A0A3D8LGM3_9BACT|nr:hypothetical protein [Pontibacter diazotrophicus]RDV16537.1 hypothetical protein DXT99_04920 [Pontibacter diazotrophicus]
MKNLNTLSVKEKVQQLRQKKMPIRKIAQELGVTKYAVETALKELESERLQTLFQTKEEELRTSSNTACQTEHAGDELHSDNEQTLQIVGQTTQNYRQTWVQTLFLEQQTHPDTVKNAAKEEVFMQETQQKTEEIGVKTAKTPVFPPIYGFLPTYRSFLHELQRGIHQKRAVWTHVMRNKYLLQVEKLKQQAQTHCSEHGFEYENLLLSGVLESCERYLRNVLRTAPVIQTEIGLSYVRLPLNVELVNLCRRAQDADFYFVEPEHSSAA